MRHTSRKENPSENNLSKSLNYPLSIFSCRNSFLEFPFTQQERKSRETQKENKNHDLTQINVTKDIIKLDKKILQPQEFP